LHLVPTTRWTVTKYCLILNGSNRLKCNKTATPPQATPFPTVEINFFAVFSLRQCLTHVSTRVIFRGLLRKLF